MKKSSRVLANLGIFIHSQLSCLVKSVFFKVRWIDNDNGNMIAIAALQFIRIYDLNVTNVPSTFEFVLPVGDVTELAFGM